MTQVAVVVGDTVIRLHRDVTTVAAYEAKYGSGDDVAEVSDLVARGWTRAGGIFSAPAAPTALETWRASCEITRLQLAFAMREAAILNQSEAIAFAGYELPAPVMALISTLPAGVQDDATLTMAGARDFPRADPMWDLLAAGEGWPDDTDIDAIFGWQA